MSGHTCVRRHTHTEGERGLCLQEGEKDKGVVSERREGQKEKSQESKRKRKEGGQDIEIK